MSTEVFLRSEQQTFEQRQATLEANEQLLVEESIKRL